ncbi:MAG TPA: hypothetical protein VMO80_14010 [Terriglobales bacterium]|nr:hypothetical protein [Terriglobales bacterium]
MKKLGFLLFLVLMLGIASGTTFAQFENSDYFVTYYSNANTAGAPDATVRIINDGDAGNLWAAFYVFDDSQELTECCACFVSPDGLLSESVNKELTANPLTGPPLKTRGAIKVISSATPDPTAAVAVPGLRGWATHIQRTGATTFAVTEADLADSNLAPGEQTLLQELCLFDGLLSGKPCICTPEDHDF